MASKNEQDIFLQKCIVQVPVARRTKKKSKEPSPNEYKGNKTRTFTYLYFVTTQRAGQFQVCKTAFQSLFAVSPDRLRRLCNLIKEGKLPVDQRGKHDSRRAIPGPTCQQIVDHINSFPIKTSHYSSKEIQYLSAELDVKKMFNLFKEKYPETNVKYEFYLKIFNERFSLRFGRPQIDTCCTCESLEVRLKSPSLNENAKRVATAELLIHKRRSKKFYHKLKEIKDICNPLSDNYNETVLGIAFDFMMNISLPRVPVQETFYLRQLSVSVFCITNLKTNTSKFYIYHEGVAGKSPNEVTSFVDDYIKTELSTGIQTLYVFSDSCGGQNKNHTLLRYFAGLVETKNFKKIEQCYPVRGHSFLPCDRAFGCIKRKLNKVDRIYDLTQVAEIIASASPKFEVKLVASDDIFDFKTWWTTYFKKSCLSDCSYGRNVAKSKKINLQISKFSHFIHSIDKNGKVVAMEYIDNHVSELVFTIRLPKKSAVPEVLVFPTDKAYKSKKPINIKKIDDIRKLMPYVPEERMSFYNAILEWPTTTVDNRDGDDERGDD